MSFSFLFVSELFCDDEDFEILVILSAILLLYTYIKSPLASAVF